MEDTSGNADMYTLSHPTDYLEYRYLIDKDVKCWINMGWLVDNDNWKECQNIGWRYFNTTYKGAWPGTRGRIGMAFYGINNGYEIKLDPLRYDDMHNELFLRTREDSRLADLVKFEKTPCTPYYVLEAEFKRNGLWYKPAIQYENLVVVRYSLKPTDTGWEHDSYDNHPEKNLHNFERSPVVSKEINANSFAGNLTVTYTHLGKTGSQKIPVYFEQRACAKNQ